MKAGLLGRFEQQMGVVDLPSCSDDELGSLVKTATRCQRRLEGYLTKLMAEAQRRENTGSGSPAGDVIRSDGEVSSKRADQLGERAQLGETLPAMGSSIESGDARTENADLVARAAAGLSPSERERLVACDREITERAANLPPEVFAKFLRKKLAAIKDAPVDEPSKAERQRAASRFDMRRRHDGMWTLWGDLDDERGALINDIIRRHARHLAGAKGSTANDRAAALVELITRTRPSAGRPDSSAAGRSATNRTATRRTSTGRSTATSAPTGSATSGFSADRPNDDGSTATGPVAGSDDVAGFGRLGIGYIVDAQTLAERPHAGSVAQTWAGHDVDPSTIQRLACDADLYAILLNRFGNPDGAGLTRRSASREQRLQLRALYDKCPIDEATPFGRCEIHHVNVFYEHGGTTHLDNLVPVSIDWHHRIHDRGWRLKMGPDRSLKLWRPDGQLYKTIPPPTPLTQRE